MSAWQHSVANAPSVFYLFAADLGVQSEFRIIGVGKAAAAFAWLTTVETARSRRRPLRSARCNSAR